MTNSEVLGVTVMPVIHKYPQYSYILCSELFIFMPSMMHNIVNISLLTKILK